MIITEQTIVKNVNDAIKSLPDKTRGKVSDGYHTFDELYDHRITLFIALSNLIRRMEITHGKIFESGVWKSKYHHDNTMFDGWFIAGIGRAKDVQMTYHLPIERWDELDVLEIDKAPEWDNHTPADVIERIKKYLY